MIEKYIVYLKQQIYKDNILKFTNLFINEIETKNKKFDEIEVLIVDKFYEDRIYLKYNDNIVSISIRHAYKNNTNFVCLTINKTFKNNLYILTPNNFIIYKNNLLLDNLLSTIIKELDVRFGFIFQKVSNFKDIIVLQGLENE